MKLKLIILIIPLLLINCSVKKKNKIEKKEIVNNEKGNNESVRIYHKIEYHENGNRSASYSYKVVNGNEIKHGTYVSYYKYGNIFRVTNYKNGFKDGNDLTFSREGFLSMNVNYKKGLYNGKYQTYCYRSKNIPQNEGTFKNDVKIGKWKEYNCQDEILAEGNYLDTMIILHFDIINSPILFITNQYGDTIDSLNYSDELYDSLTFRHSSDKNKLYRSPARIYFRTGKWTFHKNDKLIREEWYLKGRLSKVRKY